MITVAIAGYFDPFHEGHLALVQNARKLGDRVIVMANTPEQCARKHGRWFHSREGKRAILLAVGADDVVDVRDDADMDGSCAETILRTNPDIYAVGEGYTLDTLPVKEIDACRIVGCRIVLDVAPRINRSSRFWSQ